MSVPEALTVKVLPAWLKLPGGFRVLGMASLTQPTGAPLGVPCTSPVLGLSPLALLADTT